MGDVLSQSEVESLLAALDPAASASKAPVVERQRDPAELGAQISVYDFKRPERVSKDQIRTIHALHEGFGREFGAVLSGMVRSIVEVKLVSVDQLTYSEFVFSLENPTCFNLLRADPLDGHVILDVNPSILFPIIDRLLGGGRMPAQSVPRRPLTEIELRLLSRLTDHAITGLTSAWSKVCELKLKVTHVESNPQLVQIVPPNEVIVLVSFEIVLGENRGVMNLCIPYNTIEPLSAKLSANTWTSYTQKQADRRQIVNLETGVAGAAIEMVVYMASSKLTASEVMNLSVGDVIVTECDHKRPLTISLEGRPKFEGFAGLIKGHKAVRVGKPIVATEELIERKLSESAAPAAAASASPVGASR
jgi:flagellar motor switch protein FliM